MVRRHFKDPILEDTHPGSGRTARIALSVTHPRLILTSLVALLVLGLWPPTGRVTPASTKTRDGDLALFRAVISRVRAGEPYYPSMNTELRQRDYPTASLFNWRAPVTFLLVGHAPLMMRGLMVCLAAAAIVGTVMVFRKGSPALLLVAVLLQIGGVILPLAASESLYMPETWAGVLLLLSVLAYTLGAVRSGVIFAIAAVCARELVLPYVLLSLVLAVQARRSTEVRWQLAGLGLFAVYYTTHALSASAYIMPGDLKHQSWIAFGGWPFIVSTVGMGGWLLLLPRWAAAIAAVVVVASLFSPADRHLKCAVAAYFVAFAVVGHSFNAYWGFVTGPAWALATVYGVIGTRRLIAATIRPEASTA